MLPIGVEMDSPDGWLRYRALYDQDEELEENNNNIQLLLATWNTGESWRKRKPTVVKWNKIYAIR